MSKSWAYEFMIDYEIERSRWELNLSAGFIILSIHQKRWFGRECHNWAVILDLKSVGLLIFLRSKGKVFQMR